MPTLSKSRRRPAQHRSRRTVERILDAAGSLLARIPCDQFNTKRLAAEAGVSVGGLYRFFPDRESILGSITADHIRNLRNQVECEVVRPALQQLRCKADFDPTVVIPSMIDAYVGYLDEHPDFRTLSFRRDFRELSMQQDGVARKGFTAMLYNLAFQLRLDFTPETQGKLAVASEAGDCLMRYAYEQPTPEQRDQVVAEIKKMLARYWSAALCKRT